jgi:hypothetical protein
MTRILERLKVAGWTEAINLAVRRGLVRLESRRGGVTNLSDNLRIIPKQAFPEHVVPCHPSVI